MSFSYTKSEAVRWPMPNYWDVIALCLVLGIIAALGWGTKEMTTPYHLGQIIPISLKPYHLPNYALRSTLRMLIGLLFSLFFTFTFGTWAAKSKQAERLIIPLIDILQSVPVLSFLSITVMGFIVFFRGSILGPECAAIFAIFTAQAWNMALSFYQSLRTVPHDLQEAAMTLQLSTWQRFWRVEVPFAMPGLLWNAMMSMSGSWFFVTAVEAFAAGEHHIALPGIGSYIGLAISYADKTAILYAIITMLIVILIYDQLLFRPLVEWAEHFKTQQTSEEKVSHSWLMNISHRTRFFQRANEWFTDLLDNFVNLPLFNYKSNHQYKSAHKIWRRLLSIFFNLLLSIAVLAALIMLARFIFQTVTLKEGLHVLMLGAATGTRVVVLVLWSSLFWVPIGVWIGLKPHLVNIVQPIVQFCAAFPANLLFPVVTLCIVTFHLNVNIWVSPLMILGTQWYILFNVIAGASVLPKELLLVSSNLNVGGWLWWKRLALPGIFPYFVTGAITAAGGAWNASIIAEMVSWGNTKLIATGLGAYIAQYSDMNDIPRVALGTMTMCLFVLALNRTIWRPLYNLATERFQLE